LSAPISEQLLIHSAGYYPYTGFDARGKPTWGAMVTLEKVRFTSHVRSNALAGTGEQKNDRGALFYDTSISSPAGQTFQKLGKIVYGGENYQIRDVSDPSGDEGTHHVRLALVGLT